MNCVSKLKSIKKSNKRQTKAKLNQTAILVLKVILRTIFFLLISIVVNYKFFPIIVFST